MNHKRLAAHLLGVNAGGISEPVVRVNDIEVERARYHTSHYRVVVNLLNEVVGITARELQASQVVGVHVVKVTVDVVAQVVVELRIHHIANATLHIVPVHVAPGNGRVVGSDNASKVLGLIAPGLGNDKRDIHVAILGHALCQTETRGAQATQDVRRELPAKH